MAMAAERWDEGEAKAEGLDDRLKAALAAIVQRLDTEALRRVGKRQEVEKRWIEDLRAYEGKYDPETERELADAKKSQLYINKTRAKTNAFAARLGDMLFPTDDKNWGIGPTPVPELAEGATEAEARVRGAVDLANDMLERGQPGEAQKIADEGNAAATEAEQAKAVMDEARTRAKAMEAEMDDQLRECGYNIAARESIDDAAKVGTGVMKGPILSEKVRRAWRKVAAQEGTEGSAEVYRLTTVGDNRPSYRRVDYWDFFPDMDVRAYGQGEGDFERHLMTRADLRKLARQDGFDKNEIRALLKDEPKDVLPTYIAELRNITGAYTEDTRGKFHVWEYNGPIDAEEFQTLCECTGQADLMPEGEIDPLVEIRAVVWFCQGRVLMFALHPMDSDEPLYSVFTVEKDDGGPFGFGIPYVMRDPQKALNGAWRMMMDNSGLSSGPQIEVDTSVLEPADGLWELGPRKIWKRKANAQTPGIFVHEISSHQGELAGIVQMADQFVDDVTNMPVIAQGEQGAHVTQTAQGMSLLMNSVNVVFRRVVKNFDDQMTTPNIRRLYHWNMQFNPKEHIKGDFEPDARGTSVLLVREIQSQNLMAMAMNFTAHPVLGPWTKGLALYRKLVQSMMLSADEIVVTDEEWRRELQRQKDQPPPPDVEMMKLQQAMALAEMEGQIKLQIAAMERDTAMVKLAAEQNLTLAQIRADLSKVTAEIGSKERIFAAEAAITKAQPPEQPTGGGHL